MLSGFEDTLNRSGPGAAGGFDVRGGATGNL